ncbi:hypothetical protein BQ8482_160117 [Mesorhizobium delmotii]|uniref:HNH endonuclease 5 domain-containing protein n=2 Tax=Mesorhizobium delmotii TaxID=1631247 RepID=A0A2P9AHQ5_9HYPH|nr:hypothetical protein BQ8482_160117 [Mesorhizobium delmotii]
MTRDMRPSEKYGPVGQCIYCRATNVPLTDEHVVPAALDGRMILLKASCNVCQYEINKNIEQPFLRQSFKEIRYKRGIGERRNKARSGNLPLSVHRSTAAETSPPDSPPDPGKDELWITEHVANKDYPTWVVMPRLQAPGILRGVTEEQSSENHITGFELTAGLHDQELGAYVAQLLDPTVFMRMLAKIAHGAAVVCFGLDGFEASLSSIITGKDLSNIPFWIGESDTSNDPTSSEEIPSQVMVKAGILKLPTFTLVVIDIQFFVDLATPVYRVVAGKHIKDGFGLKRHNVAGSD